MKKPILQYVREFTFGTVLPLGLAGGCLVGLGYFFTSEHRLENVVVEESEGGYGTNEETFEPVFWDEIKVSNHWNCLYHFGKRLKPGTKLEYLKWNRGDRLPLLDCDNILEYKIEGDEWIYNN